MNRRELFKRLAGVGVVGIGVGVAPDLPLRADAPIARRLPSEFKKVAYGREIGRIIVVDLNEGNPHRSLLMAFSPELFDGQPITLDGWGISPETRKRLAEEFLWDEYAWRVKHYKGKFTSPRFTFVPAQNSGDPIEHNREIYGYYAEAIERV